MTLAIETADLAQAARTTDRAIAGGLDDALLTLQLGLTLCGGMAGSDPAGRSWAASYDPAASRAARAGAQLADAAGSLAALFARSALNYERADEASAGVRSHGDLLAGAPSAGGPIMVSGGRGVTASLASAAGGSAPPPTLWGLVETAVGYAWPNGHQDRLRCAAAAWRSAAGVLDHVVYELAMVLLPVSQDRLPEAADMTSVCCELQGHVVDLSAAFVGLGAACDELAGHIDAAHAGVEDALTDLAWQTGAVEVLGGIVSFFTAGAAEAPTQEIEAGRIAAAVTRIRALLETFIMAARSATARVVELAGRIERVAGGAARLLRLRPVFAETMLARFADDAGELRFFGAASRGSEGFRDGDEAVNLASPERTKHILDGDGPGSGGHYWPGGEGKTPFPKSWSREKVMHDVSDVATDPASEIRPSIHGRVSVTGMRDGVRIKVIVNYETDTIVSAFPTNLPRNP